MLVANSVYRDPRVVREARALGHAGHEVIVAGLQEETTIPGVNPDQPFRVEVFPAPDIERLRRLAALWAGAAGRRGGALPDTKARAGLGGTLRVAARSGFIALLFRATERSYARVEPALLSWAPDVVHAHDLNTLRPAVRIGRKLGVPVVFDSHEVWPEMGNLHGLYKAWMRSVERHALKHVDRVITVSDSIGALFADRYGVETPVVVFNAPELQTTIHSAKPPPLDTGREVVFLYHGALSTGRGIEQLVRAFGHTEAACRLIVRGAGPLESTLRTMVDQLPAGRVDLQQPVPPERLIEAAGADADIGVIPFLPDSLNNRLALPNKFFEYLAAGLAVLSVDIPEIRRFNERYHLARFAPGLEPVSLARGIDAMVNDPELAVLKTNAAHAHAEALNWQQASKVLVDLYQNLEPGRD